AYRLMDSGQNARAIVLLEQYLNEKGNDSSSEARILLASALLGQVGVDIFRLHDSFRDILFDHPLSERLWGNPLSDKKENENSLPARRRRWEERQKPVVDPPTAIETFIDRLGFVLEQVRNIVSFVNRFPHVIRANWGLLDKALDCLEPVGGT